MSLRDLIAAATTPPADDERYGKNSGQWAAYDRARAKLDRIMRDPATALLLADMADEIRDFLPDAPGRCSDPECTECRHYAPMVELLARFRDLESRA